MNPANEMRANADKLAELCRVLEVYSHEIPDSEAGQMLKRYLPKIEELSGQLAFDVRSLTAELLAALAGCADALREAGKDFAQANKLAARPNLYELHERSARAAIAKAKGGAA